MTIVYYVEEVYVLRFALHVDGGSKSDERFSFGGRVNLNQGLMMRARPCSLQLGCSSLADGNREMQGGFVAKRQRGHSVKECPRCGFIALKSSKAWACAWPCSSCCRGLFVVMRWLLRLSFPRLLRATRLMCPARAAHQRPSSCGFARYPAGAASLRPRLQR